MANFSVQFVACILLLNFSSLFHFTEGLVCKRERRVFELFTKDLYCPGPGDDSDEAYCCQQSDGEFYCCDLDEFAKSKGIQFAIPVVIGVVIGILAGCFLCCLCCPCCMLYKRRHQGTVYGRVQQPAAVVNIQTSDQNSGFVASPTPMPTHMPMPMPVPLAQTSGGFTQQPPVLPYPQYPGPTTDCIGQTQVPPPPYSAAVANEVYAKQAPYNPNFYGN